PPGQRLRSGGYMAANEKRDSHDRPNQSVHAFREPRIIEPTDLSPPLEGCVSYRERVTSAGPKKLLALDGGGIRGVLSLEVLAAIEQTLRSELNVGDTFVLADYFDYVAGTSTGAIIAAGLATGMSVDELRTLYAQHGVEMFDRAAITKRLKYRYDSTRLQGLLQRTFGAETSFGDDRLRSLLMMVLRNATTDSPWPLSNNPGAKFNQPGLSDNNLLLPLWQLVRASTAAPTFFPPESVSVGSRDFVFVDGGMTMYNNPSFQLFLMATLDVYGLGWKADERELLLISVGTGSSPQANADLQPGHMNLLFNASSVPGGLMSAALAEQDLLCRVFGRCRHGAPIDLELGDLRSGPGILDRRLFSYVRYDAELTREGLDHLGLPDIQPEQVQRLDSVAYIGDLQRVGMRVGLEVDPGHFDGFV
ncbi:MAG: patatin-like phospholipase family protein, partial [Streptosporangiaceae bacterium]